MDNEKLLNEIKKGILIKDIFTTKTRLKETHTIDTGIEDILHIQKGMGTLKELFIDGASGSFNVYILVDNNVVYDYVSWTFFNSNKDYLTNIHTDTGGGRNQLTIRDIKFQHTLLIKIQTTTSIAFTTIMSRVDVRDDILIDG